MSEPVNPLFEPSTLPFQLPPFADITPEHITQALVSGMSAQLEEVAQIAADPDTPGFENTVVALERSGQLLNRAQFVFYNLLSSLGTPELEAIERDFAPRLAAHADAIMLDRELFARVDAFDATALAPDQRFLYDRYHLDFVLAGAQLDPEGQQRLRESNGRISVLTTQFQQNLQAATDAAAVQVGNVSELDGMSEDAVSAAAEAAVARGKDGYVLPLVLPSQQPALAVLRDRELRTRLLQASITRAPDNGPVLIEIARERARRARLLGFATHADAMLADQTARTTANVDELFERVIPPAVANARSEADRIRAAAAQDGVDAAPQDWTYYAERIRAAEYDVDTAALTRFFPLESVLVDGVFAAATGLYGITFAERTDLHGYHPDVRVFQVDDTTSTPLGLFLADFYGREGKRGGAWMSSFVDQSRLLGQPPVVTVNLNIDKPSAAGPACLTLDEVDTLFHEFGHALHGLFSQVDFPRVSGTSVPRDFVEYPSQVNEMWALWPELVSGYARDAKTGEPLPDGVRDAIERAETWGQGFRTVEYLAAAVLDQAWHRIDPDEEIEDAEAFEREALAKAGLDLDLIPPRYRSTYFQHVFAGGYSAGYYSYLWAEVLDADTVEWFKSGGGLVRSSGDIFRERLLSVGGSRDVMDAFTSVVGHDPDIEPLLRRRGLDRV